MTPPVALSYPFGGRRLTENSPADCVPSHGTILFGTSYAMPMTFDGALPRNGEIIDAPARQRG